MSTEAVLQPSPVQYLSGTRSFGPSLREVSVDFISPSLDICNWFDYNFRVDETQKNQPGGIVQLNNSLCLVQEAHT